MSKIDLFEKTTALRQAVKDFETNTFVCHYYYLLNSQIRTEASVLPLNSPLRQCTYLLSVFLDTSPDAKREFNPMRWDREPIEKLLNDIEQGYLHNYMEGLNELDVDGNDLSKPSSVASLAFTNYFSNGRLSYIEQDIEKIKGVFSVHETFILKETGLEIADYLLFFEIVETIDSQHFSRFRELTAKDEFLTDCNDHYHDDTYLTDDKLNLVTEVVKAHMQAIPIRRYELYKAMPSEKVDKLLEIFTCRRQENDKVRFFNDECLLLKKPIIAIDDDAFVVPCAKQLIVAIGDFLFELAESHPTYNRKFLRSRDKFLEKKTTHLFRDFFGDDLRVFDNDFIDGAEQDLILLYRDTAFFIECKASKLNAPYRDSVAAFDRISNEFKKSIQKGYDQTVRVKEAFLSRKEVLICDSKGKVKGKINTARYKNRFSIIVTAERFGPLQTDLGLMLKLPDWDDYPWSVYIDDLEIFLLTLKRKNGYRREFMSFLTAREKLHERLICSDEVELFGYFLMDKNKFLKDCNRFEEVYISSSDMHRVFDELYKTGLGFKFERKMPEKAKINDNPIRTELRQRLGLKAPKLQSN